MKANFDMDARCEVCTSSFGIAKDEEYSYPLTCKDCKPKSKVEEKLEKPKKVTKKKPKVEGK